MFAYRHDILKALIADGVKLVVLGRDKKLADLPELKGAKDLDLLARTLHYTPETKLLAVGEENPDQVIRVFANALYQVTAKRPADPNWENRGRAVQQYELRVKRLDVRFDEKLKDLFEKSTGSGKWKGTAAIHDRAVYWTEGVLAYFDVPGYDAAPGDAAHPINSRESLKAYDPELFELVHETMAYAGHVDWRFRP
jgi:alpha-glucosidase